MKKKSTHNRALLLTATDMSLEEKTVLVLVSMSCSILIFFLINSFVLPHNLPLPKTTVVNWFTVHNHSITLDYIRFALLCFITPLSILSGWFYVLWKRNHS